MEANLPLTGKLSTTRKPPDTIYFLPCRGESIAAIFLKSLTCPATCPLSFGGDREASY